MSQNEDVLWVILELMNNNTVVMSQTLLNRDPTETKVRNAYAVGKLKGILVLRFKPSDIEDTIYFMKHRDYLQVHGYGIAAPEMVYSLSEKACKIHDEQTLPDEERDAFKESLWKFSPNIYGVGPNVKEWVAKIKKIIDNRRNNAQQG